MIPEIQSQLWYLEIGVGIIVILGIAYGSLIFGTLDEILTEVKRIRGKLSGKE